MDPALPKEERGERKGGVEDKIKRLIKESIAVKDGLLKGQIANIALAASAIVKSIRSGGKVVIFGNGGSAADSQHIAAELVGRFKKERKAIAAIALTTDTSVITALANDYGYDVVFSRQVEALGRKGDVAIAISTSGKSKNIIDAVKAAKRIGIMTIALTGSSGGDLKKKCDISISVPSDDTPRIQESHCLIGHMICELVEEECAKDR